MTQRKVNHIYLWDTVAWILAIQFHILKPVICVHSQRVTATIFQSLFALSITFQLCALCLFHSPLMNLLPELHLFMKESMEPIPQVFRNMYFLLSLPSSPAQGVLPKELGSVGQPATLCPHSGKQCQRCGHRKYILQKLFVTAASPRPGRKHVLYIWKPPSLILSLLC